jgi:hypothetical protein
MKDKTQGWISVEISQHIGNVVKYEVNNEGTKDPVTPFRRRWKHAKFKLPSGKKKCEVFPYDKTPEEILSAVQKTYSNFKFKLPAPPKE